MWSVHLCTIPLKLKEKFCIFLVFLVCGKVGYFCCNGCYTYQHVRRHTLALPAGVECSWARQASFPDLFLKWSDMNQKTWLPRQPFHKVIVWIFHNESCASFTDSVVPAVDGFQRCVSLLQAFFQLQNDETTKKVVLVTLLICRNCIHKLIGFVSCLQNLMHKYIVFSSLRHQQIDVLVWQKHPILWTYLLVVEQFYPSWP